MSFEWQDRDAAARTLGVDSKTLQAWIDDGRAPSRSFQGRTQVLIEHLDDAAAEEAAPDQPSAGGGSADAAKAVGHGEAAAAEPEPAQRVHAQPASTDLELVSKRELQLAGGMVAAWQRLAETSNQDLARARKVGALSWSLVGVLVVLGGIGLWWSTHSVTDTQGRLQSTQEKLVDVERSASDSQSRAAALQAELNQRALDLADANSRLTATTERANLTKSQADAIAAQHLLTRQVADRQAETAKALIETLQGTIDEQKQRLAAMERDLAADRQTLAKLTEELSALTERDRQRAADAASQKTALEEATKQRDAFKKQLDDAADEKAKSNAAISQLEKQVAAMRAELDRTRTAEK